MGRGVTRPGYLLLSLFTIAIMILLPWPSRCWLRQNLFLGRRQPGQEPASTPFATDICLATTSTTTHAGSAKTSDQALVCFRPRPGNDIVHQPQNPYDCKLGCLDVGSDIEINKRKSSENMAGASCKNLTKEHGRGLLRLVPKCHRRAAREGEVSVPCPSSPPTISIVRWRRERFSSLRCPVFGTSSG